ncbi:MAG: hypothetical protein KGK03_10015, partial [Candidatus Omnitrophica bacterium]|nr:hypothetical protein [Candidatus Omnitrophota bacterium]
MKTVNYVILTTGRNGSTLLCKLLALNGIFKDDG